MSAIVAFFYQDITSDLRVKEIIIIIIIIIIIRIIIITITITVIINSNNKYWVSVQRGIAVSHEQEQSS